VVKIKLQRGQWEYDPENPLAPPGGFGQVFAGTGLEHGEVAVKRLKLEVSEVAHRELRLADELVSRELDHVMPILDCGQDAESDKYYVVMPRAERSLQEEVQSATSWSEIEAAEILLQIVRGLEEVPDIVHRDLKPDNVLLHDGKWKIADFGIARFVEDSTSARTLRGCLTPQFAAPEQWKLERTTGATDLYAVGCIAHVLLTGSPPFHGPSHEDYRRQHIEENPPSLGECSPLCQSLVSILLLKASESRPGLARVVALLERLAVASSENASEAGLNALARVSAGITEDEAADEARAEAERSRVLQRVAVAKEALRILRDEVVEWHFQQLLDAAPAMKYTNLSVATIHRQVVLGVGKLSVFANPNENPISKDAFSRCGWDVVAGATIAVAQLEPPYGWSASLWYGNTGDYDCHRWFEVSYYDSPLVRSKRTDQVLFALEADEADEAASPVIGVHQIAFGPQPIDAEDAYNFHQRWTHLLTLASQGKLQHPRALPLAESFFEDQRLT